MHRNLVDHKVIRHLKLIVLLQFSEQFYLTLKCLLWSLLLKLMYLINLLPIQFWHLTSATRPRLDRSPVGSVYFRWPHWVHRTSRARLPKPLCSTDDPLHHQPTARGPPSSRIRCWSHGTIWWTRFRIPVRFSHAKTGPDHPGSRLSWCHQHQPDGERDFCRDQDLEVERRCNKHWWNSACLVSLLSKFYFIFKLNSEWRFEIGFRKAKDKSNFR